MATSILTTTDDVTIRGLMGANATQLPTAILFDFAHELQAEVWAQLRVPTWSAIIDGSNLADISNLKNAVAYRTAYLCASSLALLVYDREVGKQGGIEYQYQRNRQVDWAAQGLLWKAQADEYINQVSTRAIPAADVTPPGPQLVGPSRGGYGW